MIFLLLPIKNARDLLKVAGKLWNLGILLLEEERKSHKHVYRVAIQLIYLIIIFYLPSGARRLRESDGVRF